MPEFVEYFRKQWIVDEFKNWQIFLTSAGYAHTNSPIESHNSLYQFQAIETGTNERRESKRVKVKENESGSG